MSWYGYRGQILEVNLSERKIQVTELTEKDTTFIGGAGLNAWLLYKNCKPGTKPFDGENPLIFGAGPLVATGFPCGARSSFTSLSPLTEIFGDANGGGFFGPAVRQAGFDHIVVKGISGKPCYLLIGKDGKCSIEDASDLWGKDTVETEKILKEKHPGGISSYIGPGGENLVTFANILTNHSTNAWARTGLGAVMGSKKLKAIVVTGKGKVPVYNPEAFKALSEKIKKAAAKSISSELFSKLGTMTYISLFPALGLFYRLNGRYPVTFKESSQIDVASFYKKTDFKVHGCYQCPLKCEKNYTIKEGPYKGEEGYRYEMGYAFPMGFNLGVEDLPSVLHLSNYCNRAGLDIIETGSVIGTAIDLYQDRIINSSDTDGLTLDWGRVQEIEKLIGKITRQEGFGSVLSKGAKKATEIIGRGSEKYALHIKGMSEVAHCAPPFMLGFAVATRGGDHLKGMPTLCLEGSNVELVEKLCHGTKQSLDINTHNDKGRIVWWHENYKTVLDSLGTCFFLASNLLPMGYMIPSDFAEAYSLATGIEMDEKEIVTAGERIYQIEKAFNARLGINRKDDSLIVRNEPGAWGSEINLEHPGMLDEYYIYRGCSKDGLPLRERLEEVDLKDIGDELEKTGHIGSCNGEYMSIHKIIRKLDDGEDNNFSKRIQKKAKEFVVNIISDPKVVNFISDPKVFTGIAAGLEKRRLRRKAARELFEKLGNLMVNKIQ